MVLGGGEFDELVFNHKPCMNIDGVQKKTKKLALCRAL